MSTLITHAAALQVATGDARQRTVSAIVATETPTLVYGGGDGLVEEVLRMDGVDLLVACPLLCDHQRSVATMIGSARALRRQGGNIVADLHFVEGVPEADNAWRLVDGRHLTDISIGYEVLAATVIPADRTQVVGGRSYTAPSYRRLRISTKWRLREVSVVPLGADEFAGIRSSVFSDHPLSQGLNSMSTLSVIPRHVLSGMRLATFAEELLKSRGEAVPDNDCEAVRTAFSTGDGIAELNLLAETAVLAGFRGATDSLAGIYDIIPANNYLVQQLASMKTPTVLKEVPRGSGIHAMNFGMASRGDFRLARFVALFGIDEQDALDAGTIGTYQHALAEIGQAARRMISDLLFSVLLSNPNLADGAPLFDASRGNLASGGASALDDTALDLGLAAIGDQVGTAVDGQPVHYGLQAAYLIVAPEKLGVAQKLARARATGSGDLVVRADSRLSTRGVVNPRSGESLVGNASNWLLASPAAQSPSLVLGLLGGRAEPRIGSRQLTAGQWGVEYDAKLSVAAAAVDGKGLYFSRGE